MGSLGSESTGRKKKAMWLYPKVVGFNPTERWGHSACCIGGIMYVFGGCCGGSHFGEVLALDLETTTWAQLATTGEAPGTRDSHTAVAVGQRMVVFGGTNGSRKVSDVHVLDVRTREWRRQQCTGESPCARESHTATVIGGERMVVFGGSGVGGGGARYLNDVHVLELGSMEWRKAETSGEAPAARDSHVAVAVGSKVVVYGGDCGDRYHGQVDVLDVDSMSWSTLAVRGPSPGVRAGHAAVGLGNKVYVIGGVGDKNYYGDVWVLDLDASSWSQLDTAGQRPQGRFSHTAVVANSDIIIYGGCGEDERPLNELLVLQLGAEHPNGRYNVSMCKIFGSQWSQYKHKFIKSTKVVNHTKRRPCAGRGEDEAKLPTDDLHMKRTKLVNDNKHTEIESELEEHSLSLSQGSSPSHSDHEQNARRTASPSHRPVRFSPPNTVSCNQHQDPRGTNHGDGKFSLSQHRRQEMQMLNRPPLIGAEVHGTVDGAFDSGFLMTACVNGQLFRGVLFAPGPLAVIPRPMVNPRSLSIPVIVAQPQVSSPGQSIPIHSRPLHLNVANAPAELARHAREMKTSPTRKPQPSLLSSDLQGVVLTLGGPGGCD